MTWTERRLFVRSLMQAKAAETALRTRLDKAQAALEVLNEHKQGRRRFREVEALRQTAEEIVQQHQLEGLLSLSYEQRLQERRVRWYGDRPAEVRLQREMTIRVRRDEIRLEQSIAHLGWRVYGTNHSPEQLPLAKAILAYRQEYLVERGFARLKGKPLSLTPMYLQDDRRVTGLIRSLSLGLRILTLLEFVVQRKLSESKEKLAGLYAGNPKRTTTPRAETLLEAFKPIYLTVVTLGQEIHPHITPLSALQQKILALWNFSPDIYSRLAIDFSKPP